MYHSKHHSKHKHGHKEMHGGHHDEMGHHHKAHEKRHSDAKMSSSHNALHAHAELNNNNEHTLGEISGRFHKAATGKII